MNEDETPIPADSKKVTDLFSFASALLDSLFPRRCLVCSIFLSHPLSRPGQNQILENYLCASCRQHLQVFPAGLDATLPAAVEQVFSAYLYAGPLEKIIPSWKYHKRYEFSPLIRILLHQALSRPQALELDFDLITAIPLSARALRRRGFNQAFFIASHCASFYRRPLAGNLLVKTADTPQQASLGRRARRGNLSPEIFQVPESGKITGKNILLCDDVLTTGATLNAAAGALKRAGAASVRALTLARAVL